MVPELLFITEFKGRYDVFYITTTDDLVFVDHNNIKILTCDGSLAFNYTIPESEYKDDMIKATCGIWSEDPHKVNIALGKLPRQFGLTDDNNNLIVTDLQTFERYVFPLR